MIDKLNKHCTGFGHQRGRGKKKTKDNVERHNPESHQADECDMG